MSIITSPSQSLPDFTELAEKLQATAQALLAFGSQHGPEPEDEPPAAEKAPPPEETAPPEIRSFLIPGFMVEEERQMLKLLKANDWQEMFDKTYDQLYAMALLLRHFDTEEELDGFAVQLVGNTIMAPLDTLRRLCSLIADFRPVAEGEEEEEEE